MKNIEKIKPSGIFTNYIYKSIPLAFDESMSYYETLCGVLNLLKDQEIIVNNNADALKELQDYVTHYFDNLDVQEEINNKLDQMAESGELEQIIAEYLETKAVYGFDSVGDMIASTNLINGSYARTLGYYSKNDGGSALYKIRNVTNEDNIDNGSIIAMNDNTLVAELIISDKVNVKQFGAKGDATTDDTIAIQNAINYCITNNMSLYIDNDTYYITNTLTINANNVFIRCEGTITTDKNITCILYNGSNSDIYINKITNTSHSYIGTAFLCNKTMTGVKLKINYIYSFDKGISLYTSGTNPAGIYYNYIYNDYNEGMYCIYLNANSSFINNNYFYLGHLSGNTGIYSESIASSGEYNNNIIYNAAFELLSKAVYLNNFDWNKILNFRFMESVIDTHAFILNNSRNNTLTSSASLLLTPDRIVDNASSRGSANIWKALIRNNDSWLYADEFISYKNIIEITHNLSLDTSKSVLNTTYHTNTTPLSCFNGFYIEGSTAETKIYLDERYTHANTLYDNVILEIYIPKDTTPNIKIYYEGETDANFDISKYTITSGKMFIFVGKIGVNKRFRWFQRL